MSATDGSQATDADVPAPTTTQPKPPPPGPTVSVPVAVLALVGAVVVALLLVAAVIRLDTPRLPTAPPRDPPAGPAAPTTLAISYDRVSFQEFSVTLPDGPFSCGGDNENPAPAFPQYTQCIASVHRNYDGDHSWVATVGVALLDDSVGAPGDLPQTTGAAFDAMLGVAFRPSDHASVSDRTSGPATVSAPAGQAFQQQADVHIRVARLPTSYDRLTTVVVELRSGRRMAVFTDIPGDAGQEIADAAATSVATIKAQP